MSNSVLIIGASGTGKSTSLCNLNNNTTFIINVLDKALPFKGFKKRYKHIKGWDDKEGNYFVSDDWARIVRCIDMVNKERPDITTLVIDDWQYILAYEFIKRVTERGYDKYSELAMHGWATMNACIKSRETLNCFILAHSEADNSGKVKTKTVGKLLDEKITLEGLFTTVLHSRVIDGKYVFQTQFDGEYVAKSPQGLFEDKFIPNDLQIVIDALKDYYNEEE